MWNFGGGWRVIGLAGIVVLVGCAGRGSTDPCYQAGQHVAQCLGQSFDPQGESSCSPETVAQVLATSCEEIQSQYGGRSSQGFGIDQFLCEVMRVCWGGGNGGCLPGLCGGCQWGNCEEEGGECHHYHADEPGGEVEEHFACHNDRNRRTWYKACPGCPWERVKDEGWDEWGDESENECCHEHSDCEDGCKVYRHDNSCSINDKHVRKFYRRCGEGEWHHSDEGDGWDGEGNEDGDSPFWF